MLTFFKRLLCSHQWKTEYTSFGGYPCLKTEVLECTKCGKAKTKAYHNHDWGTWNKDQYLRWESLDRPYILMTRRCKCCCDIDSKREYV